MSDLFRSTIKTMVKETFEGPPVPVNGSWFTETKPNSGIFGLVDELSHTEASQPVYGTTLAAHVDHIRYHMWGINEIVKNGEQPKMDWGQSWEIQSVDDQQWQQIQKELRTEYSTLMQAIDAIEWNELLANEVLSSLAHSAYHLGALKQMMKAIKA